MGLSLVVPDDWIVLRLSSLLVDPQFGCRSTDLARPRAADGLRGETTTVNGIRNLTV